MVRGLTKDSHYHIVYEQIGQKTSKNAKLETYGDLNLDRRLKELYDMGYTVLNIVVWEGKNTPPENKNELGEHPMLFMTKDLILKNPRRILHKLQEGCLFVLFKR